MRGRKKLFVDKHRYALLMERTMAQQLKRLHGAKAPGVIRLLIQRHLTQAAVSRFNDTQVEI